MSEHYDWMHPLAALARASRTLSIRMMELERTPAEQRDEAWWDRYLRTLDILERVIGRIEGLVKPISQQMLRDRFAAKKA